MKDPGWMAGDLTREQAAWETWAGKVAPGDRCEVAGVRATVTAVTDDYLWARIDGQADALPWEWEDTGPVTPPYVPYDTPADVPDAEER